MITQIEKVTNSYNNGANGYRYTITHESGRAVTYRPDQQLPKTAFEFMWSGVCTTQYTEYANRIMKIETWTNAN